MTCRLVYLYLRISALTHPDIIIRTLVLPLEQRYPDDTPQ